MESVNIKELVQSCQDGNQAAFRELYEATLNKLYPFVFARVSDKTVATELTQDIYVELHTSLRRFSYQSDVAFYSFLFTIARRQLARYYASAKRRQAVSFEETHHGTVVTDTETVAAVEMALAKLDDCSREIVVMHHWSRFTFSEIAQLINMTESAVRVRHHRAKETLANLLDS